MPNLYVRKEKLFGDFYCNRVNTIKFETLFHSKNCPRLTNACKCIEYINNYVSSIEQL